MIIRILYQATTYLFLLGDSVFVTSIKVWRTLSRLSFSARLIFLDGILAASAEGWSSPVWILSAKLSRLGVPNIGKVPVHGGKIILIGPVKATILSAKVGAHVKPTNIGLCQTRNAIPPVAIGDTILRLGEGGAVFRIVLLLAGRHKEDGVDGGISHGGVHGNNGDGILGLPGQVF